MPSWICSVIFRVIAFTLITPILILHKKYGPDLDWLQTRVPSDLDLWQSESSHTVFTKSTVSPQAFFSTSHPKRCQFDLDHAQIPKSPCSIEIFSLSFLQMDKVGQSWQVAIELLSLSKSSHGDLKKSTSKHVDL